MLKLAGVSASYGSVPAISDITIEIGEGEAVGLLGANGAGKSTTLRVISGLVKPRSGSIVFAGANLASLPPHRFPPSRTKSRQGAITVSEKTIRRRIARGGE